MPNPLFGGVYQASFTVAAVIYGFDIRTSSYGEETNANMTIRPVPWANIATYTVVMQSGGSMPVTRTYRAVVYTEDAYLLLRGQRGQVGFLVTPREPSRSAVLTSCKRSDFQDPYFGASATSGMQTLDLSFTMLT